MYALALAFALLALLFMAIGGRRMHKRMSALECGATRLKADVREHADAINDAKQKADEADNKAWRAHLRIDRMQDGEKVTKQADWRDSAAFTAFDWRKPEQR